MNEKAEQYKRARKVGNNCLTVALQFLRFLFLSLKFLFNLRNLRERNPKHKQKQKQRENGGVS